MIKLVPQKLLIFALCLGTSAEAQNAGQCQIVIDKGLREYNIESSSEANLNTVYRYYCEQTAASSQSGFSSELDAVVKAIPVKFTLGSSNSKTSMSNFCQTYSSLYQSSSTHFSYQEKVASKAYDTYLQCIKFISYGVSVDHEVLNVETTGFIFKAGVNRPIEIRGVQPSKNVKCTGQHPASGLVIDYGPSTRVSTHDNLGFTCVRSSTLGPNGERLYAEGTIAILTNFDRYDLYLPQSTQLAQIDAAAITQSIAQVESKVTATNDRVTGIKLQAGPMFNETFNCRGEATRNVDSNPVTVMVGTRWGLCDGGISSANYYKTLEVVVPSVK
jgi:hypothetical protein